MPTAPPGAPSTDGPPATGFQIQARLPTQIGFSSFITPGFSIGYRTGNLVIGAEVGATAGSLEDNGQTDSFRLIHIMPMLYLDVWQSDDGRARLNLVGGAGIGQGKITSTTTMSTSETSATFIPVLAGLGGDYYLHRNFALGVEFGAQLPILVGVTDNGMDRQLKGGVESLHGMIRVTFVTGR
jgi:hypothetical protein